MKRQRPRRHILLLTTSIVALLACLATASVWRYSTQKPSPIQLAAKRATFPLYDPTKLPQGYTLDQKSFSMTSQAMLITATDATGHNIIFTQQPVPKEFDFETFYTKQFVGSRDISSIYGRGKTGILDTVTTGSLVTDSTWIIVKGTENLPANDMETIIKGLKPVRP